MNFPDLGKMKQMLSQAQAMQGEMEQKLSATVVEATTGAGVVTVRMNGRKELLRLKISPTAMGTTPKDLELLEDLITAAVNQAGLKADEAMKASTTSMLGGFGLHGLE